MALQRVKAADTRSPLTFRFEKHAHACQVDQRLTQLRIVQAGDGSVDSAAFWICADARGAPATFSIVDTAQITLATPSLRDSTLVTVTADASLLANFDSYVILQQGARQGPIRFGCAWRCPPFRAYAHCTLVPCRTTDCWGEATPDFDENYCCAIWISGCAFPPPTPLPAGGVHYLTVHGNVAWRNTGNPAAWACLREQGVVTGDVPFRRPAWTYSSGRFTYAGTLAALGDLSEGDVQIWLDPCSTLEVPLSMTSVTLPFLCAADASDTHELLCYLEHSLDSHATAPDSPALSILVDWSGSLAEYVSSARTGARVTVAGTGCIDGSRLARLGECVVPLQDLCPGRTTLGELLYRLEFEVLSGLLEIHAEAAGVSPAVIVSGPRILYPPKRYRSAVQLNGYNAWDGTTQTPPCGAVEVIDLKVAGGWVAASDGPDVLAPRSQLCGLYLHTAGDAVKLGATGMSYRDVTLLQGNAGAAVNIGCSGILPCSISDVSAEGLHLHRVCHASDSQLASVTSLVATRNACRGASVRRCLVADMSVPFLGGAATTLAPTGAQAPGSILLLCGPNLFQRVSSLGFLVGDTPGDCELGAVQDTVLEDIALRNLCSDVVPLAPAGDWHLLYKRTLCGDGRLPSLPATLAGISYADVPSTRVPRAVRDTYASTACRVYVRRGDPSMVDYFVCPNGGSAASGVDSYWLQASSGYSVPRSIFFTGTVARGAAVWPYKTSAEVASTQQATLCRVPVR